MDDNLLDRSLVAARFRRHQSTYRRQATVQVEMARKLADALPCQEFGRALEFGCGTGVFTELLRTECRIGTLFLNDLNPVPSENFLQGDIETVAIPGGFDLVAANAVWQWLAEPRRLLDKLATALNPGGVIAVSSFAPGNLAEITALTGISLPYAEPETLHADFSGHFDIVRFEIYERILHFADPRQILDHLKATGVTGVTAPGKWTRGRLERFSAAYAANFSDGGRVRLTYRPLLIVGYKKGPLS